MKALTTFKVGEHYDYCGKRYQLTDIDEQRVEMRLLYGPPTVVIQEMAHLRSAAHRGKLTKVQEAPITCSSGQILAELSDRHGTRFSIAWAYVNTVEKMYSGCLSRADLPELIEHVKHELGSHKPPSYSTLCNWRRAYRTGGAIALIPKAHHLHHRHISHQPEEIAVLIREHAKQLYWTLTPVTKSALIKAISFSIEDLNRLRPMSRRYREPSATTLWRIICELDAFQTMTKQKGKSTALRSQRYGASLPEPDCLLEKVEADTQMLHLFVVDKKGRVIGRPYLTVFLEVKTRHVIGWHISLNPPSLDTTVCSLKKSLSSDNLYAGAAALYVFDNGSEFIAEALRRVLGLFGAQVNYCEPGTPNQKPHVEAFFKTWSTQIVHSMSGTTFSRIDKRGEYDSEKHAVYTLDEVSDIFARWLELYHQDHHSALSMSPNEAWAKCLEHELPPRKYSDDDLRRCFWRKERVKPSSQGRVRTHNVHWQGPAVRQLADRYPKSKVLYLYFDPADLAKAYVCHPNYPMDRMEVDAVHPQYQNGLTLHFHEDIQRRKREQRSNKLYITAEEARIQLLWEISHKNKKADPRRQNQLLEGGDVTQLEVATSTAPTDRPAERLLKQHQYHQDTPEEFAVKR